MLGLSPSQRCTVTCSFNQRLLGVGQGFRWAARYCGSSCSCFVRRLYKFTLGHLYFILYNKGHGGKHNKISFPCLKTKKPEKSPGFFFFYLVLKQTTTKK